VYCIFPSAICPPHKQVPHVDYNCPRFRIDTNKMTASFDRGTCRTSRRIWICYFNPTQPGENEEAVYGINYETRRAYDRWLRHAAGVICSGHHPEVEQAFRNFAQSNGLHVELAREILIYRLEVRLILEISSTSDYVIATWLHQYRCDSYGAIDRFRCIQPFPPLISILFFMVLPAIASGLPLRLMELSAPWGSFVYITMALNSARLTHVFNG
jgi:hypothetical protein